MLATSDPAKAVRFGGTQMQYRVAVLASSLATAIAAAPAHAGVTVYLEAHGAALTAGQDDAAAGVSSLLWGRGLRRVQVPAFQGGERTWAKVVACVRDGFARFDVDIVDDPPAGDDYTMIVVGGRPGLLGYGGEVSGVAPWDGSLQHAAIGFVFSDHLDDRVDAVCAGIMHEAGHTMGLDHSYYCPDVMSYLHGCGEKSFTDVDAACGEYEERDCAQGGAAQNSYQLLARNVGLRNGGAEPATPPEDEEDSESDDSPQPDSSSPADPVELWGLDDGSVNAGNQFVALAVRAAGAARVELGWASAQRTWTFRCDDMPADVPAACYREGDVYVFALMVGTGDRAFAVRVTGDDGDQRVSEIRKVSFR
jgi:hypothetical protein